MNKIKNSYYLTPALMAFLLFISNFIKADILQHAFSSYSVWFVIMLLVFACGYLMNKTIGYSFGGKIVFAVIVANVAVGIFMVSFFSQYFGFEDMTVENMLLYSLRLISVGSMGSFGLAVNEVFFLQQKLLLCEQKKITPPVFESGVKEADLTIKDAKLRAEKIILEAEKKQKEMQLKAEQFEAKIKELVRVERELIKKYEQNDEE